MPRHHITSMMRNATSHYIQDAEKRPSATSQTCGLTLEEPDDSALGGHAQANHQAALRGGARCNADSIA